MDSSQLSDEWEVEQILDKKEQSGQIFYKVFWKGFDLSEATWEPSENLVNVQAMIKKFECQRLNNTNQLHKKVSEQEINQQKKAQQSLTRRSNINSKKNNAKNKSKQQKLSRKKQTKIQTDESLEESNIKKRASNGRQLEESKKGRKIVRKAQQEWDQIAQKQKDRSQKSTIITKKLQNYLSNLQVEGRPNHQRQTVIKMKNTCLKLDSQRQRWYQDEGLTQVGIKRLRNVEFQQLVTSDNLTSKDSLKVDLFLRQKRYKQCDQMLKTQKQLTLRNIIDRQAGLQVQRRKIKMLQVEQVGLLESTLKNIPTANKTSFIYKLQLLVRSRFGWIAIGKDENNKLFMSDVNLLEEECWRGILKEGTQS